MKLLKSNIIIGLISFAAGIGTLWGFQQVRIVKNSGSQLPPAHEEIDMDPLFDEAFNSNFFQHSNDPFEEMRKMRKQMMRQFEADDLSNSPFDSWFKKRFGGGKIGDIKKREDEKFIYYDVLISGLDKESVNVKVSEGQVTISGRQEKKTGGTNSSSYMSSSFQRSFPIPPNVDGNKVQMNQEKDKLVVKFPKKV